MLDDDQVKPENMCTPGVDFEVRMTDNRGYGLFAKKEIAKGAVVTKYGGVGLEEIGARLQTHIIRRLESPGIPRSYIDALPISEKIIRGEYAAAYLDGVAGITNSSGNPGEEDEDEHPNSAMAWTKTIPSTPYLVTTEAVPPDVELIWPYRWKK